jgi:hypothetical protein
MSTPTTLLGPNDLRLLLRQTIATHPYNTNPTDSEGTCVYTDPNDPSRHCIIGQLAADQGWFLPEERLADNEAKVAMVAKKLNWPVSDAGWGFLDRVQSKADSNRGPLSQWKEIEL